MPPVAGQGFCTALRNGTEFTRLFALPAPTAPPDPPPTRYFRATTLRNPAGSALPFSPFPNVTRPEARTTTQTLSFAPNAARSPTAVQTHAPGGVVAICAA